MDNYLTYLYLLTPLHTGGSANEGNLMGIAREVHTEFPYIPSSSLRGKLRSAVQQGLSGEYEEQAELLFGKKIEGGQQPTEGEIWFADATLLFFPVASFSHQYLWVTCPLWLSRWNRWLDNNAMKNTIQTWDERLNGNQDYPKAISSVSENPKIYLQGAVLETGDIEPITEDAPCWTLFDQLSNIQSIFNLRRKLVVLSDADCGVMVEMGLQREVRIQIGSDSKTAQDGSFRSEEAIPPETMMFFPWGLKESKAPSTTTEARKQIKNIVKQRIQLGGLEGLGRGWTQSNTLGLEEDADA